MNIFKPKKINAILDRKQNEAEIKEIVFGGLKWIDIIHPSSKEMDELRNKYEFHDLLLEDCMTEHQRPKIDEYDDYCFIVLHFPRYKKELKRLETEEVDIFIGKNYIITLHEGELKPLKTFTNLCHTREDYRAEYMSDGSVLLLYEIIKRLFNYCFPMLDKIGSTIDSVNRNIFKEKSRRMLEEVSSVKMQIINYRKVMKPLRPVILTMEKVIKKYMDAEMEIYFDDITDKMEQIWNTLENYKEVIESLDSTFTSLTNQRINTVMTTFTIIQIITLPMILVGGLFSMNVEGIPLHQYNGAFWIVFGMILIPTGLIGVLLAVKRNKWF